MNTTKDILLHYESINTIDITATNTNQLIINTTKDKSLYNTASITT